jgi:hypothetical protein
MKTGMKLATAAIVFPSAEQARPVHGRCGSAPLCAVVAALHVTPEFVLK